MLRKGLGVVRQGLDPVHPVRERGIELSESWKTEFGHNIGEPLDRASNQPNLRKRDAIGSADRAPTKEGNVVDPRCEPA